ncbi:DUF2244 domain-containing protein [Pararhodobacter oceanensis]|uniref:DUF2244 domain-containing protein n=1 Tax=Pararhodobacter oceanensis TaxID=2172121 RepID=UPI003A903DD0
MPYELHQEADGRAELRLWPYNALAPRGFAVVIAMAAGTLAIPLLAVIGSKVLWGLLPFALIALWGLWYALDRNYRDRRILEAMELTRSEVTLRRQTSSGMVQEWRADPHWISLHLAAKGGPVPQYLTLTGGGREVELGAFLTPEERVRLSESLGAVLIRLKSYS